MAITQNKASAIGDVIIMKADIPILGLSDVNSFTNVIVGELAQRYFTKEFRYTLDGINWKDWQTLTNPNLEAIVVDPKHIFKIEYRYTRAGTNNTGDLELTSIELDGDFVELTVPDIYWNSIFGKFFELYNLDSLGWARNVLEKIYKNGILPQYIERNVNHNENWDDKDFIDFWFSITHFFSLFVNYSRLFQDFYMDEDLLIQYLKDKGLYLSKDMNYDELYYLMNSYFEQIRYRGTPQIAKSKSNEIYVNGELLRLINKQNHEEFIFALAERYNSIWNINNCSPLYRGIGSIRNTIKGYESSDEVVSKTNYPILNTSGVSVVTYDGSDVLQFTGPINTPTGIGVSVWDETKGLEIDPSINYEVSFWISQATLSDNIFFGIKSYDKYGHIVPIYNLNNFTIETGFFLNGGQVNIINKWYFVRGILFNKNEDERSANYKLNIGIGQNLRIDRRAFHIIPFLYTNDASVSNLVVRVKNFAVRPLETTFQRGFVGMPNMILTWMKNNSGNLSNNQIEDIMRNYLLPYNSVVLNDWIN